MIERLVQDYQQVRQVYVRRFPNEECPERPVGDLNEVASATARMVARINGRGGHRIEVSSEPVRPQRYDGGTPNEEAVRSGEGGAGVQPAQDVVGARGPVRRRHVQQQSRRPRRRLPREVGP